MLTDISASIIEYHSAHPLLNQRLYFIHVYRLSQIIQLFAYRIYKPWLATQLSILWRSGYFAALTCPSKLSPQVESDSSHEVSLDYSPPPKILDGLGGAGYYIFEAEAMLLASCR